MKNVITFLHIFAEIIIAVALCALAILQFADIKTVVVSLDSVIASERDNYVESDLTMVDGDILTGTEVISFIRKYQSKVPVEVTTFLGTTRYPGSSLAVVNNPDSISWVDPAGSFNLSVERTVNGHTSKVSITQEGNFDVVTDTVQDVNSAKVLVADALGTTLTVSTTWNDLANQIKNGSSTSIKKVVADAIGGSANENMTWQELALLVRNKINALEIENAELQTDKETNQYQKAEGTLTVGDSVDLGFSPSVICVVTEEGAENFVSSTWHGGDSCTISDTILKNNSQFVVRYYAYR